MRCWLICFLSELQINPSRLVGWVITYSNFTFCYGSFFVGFFFFFSFRLHIHLHGGAGRSHRIQKTSSMRPPVLLRCPPTTHNLCSLPSAPRFRVGSFPSRTGFIIIPWIKKQIDHHVCWWLLDSCMYVCVCLDVYVGLLLLLPLPLLLLLMLLNNLYHHSADQTLPGVRYVVLLLSRGHRRGSVRRRVRLL